MSACSTVISRLTGGRSDKKNYKEKIDSGKHFHNVLCLSEAKGMDINMKVVGIIPARYGSTRLPGKPLKDILGHPMIWWVFQRVKSVNKLDEVYVATDDNRIKIVCEENDIPVVMTANTHRIAAAIPDFVPQDVEYGTNIITEMTDPAQVMDASNIKMVFDENMNALYMSRTPIPYPFKAIDFKYYKHVGIIGYNKKMLDFYRNTKPGRFELIEGIDTLRFLDYGKQLKLSLVESCHSLSVDTEKDLEMVTKMIQETMK